MALTGSTISVVPGAFAAAGKLYSANHDAAASVVRSLAKVLDSHWGCGGTDDSGHKWCDKYDPAASNAVATATAVVNSLGKLNDLLQVTSVNHANADNGSHYDPKAGNQAQPPAATAHFDAPAFRGAYGGDTDAPLGWGLISRWVQGRMWPNGHSDGLRALSSAWTAVEFGMKGIKAAVAGARRIVSEQASGEVAQILAQIDIVDTAIDNVIGQCNELSYATTDYAQAIDTAHTKIFQELGEFLAIAGVVEGIGWLAGGPLGGAGGAVVTGARAAATGARVATIIDELAAFVAAAMPVARLVAVGAAPAVIKSVQPLLDAQPNTFYSNTRPGGATRPAHPTKPFRDDKDTVAEFDGEQAAQDVRDRLSSSGNTIRQGKNIAVAEGEIDGQFIPSRELESVSGKGSPPGTVEVPEKPTFNPRDESGDTYRPTDSEYKILEKLSTRLTPDSKGVIDLYTENKPCDACASVIKQFEEKYPGVKLNVTYTNP
ncbi:deaminase domain-containing protein [Nocardia miyunensis]|uniref:deaminase domain-containing protein n=1 Tax=Nocardia miyunensis TaxID=282684 RepID=UPI0008338F6D|nr:deaminase domain-containing protein [Nocardia miyunensis]